MTDYRSGGGEFSEQEALIGQRNENSVLFSLDSLAHIDDGENNAGGGNFAFGGSGDASGLIDLNTLAQMGVGSDASDNMDGVHIFNTVASKKSQKRNIIIVMIVLLLLAGLGVGGWFAYSNYRAAELAKEAETQKRLAEEAEKQAALEAELKAAKEREKALELEAQRRKVDEEALRKAQEERERELLAQAQSGQHAEAGAEKSGARPSGTRRPSAGNAEPAAAAAPAEPVNKGPSTEQVRSALSESAKRAGRCGKNGNLVVTMTLSANGKAKNIRADSGSFKGTPTENCIITVIGNHNFPTFSGKDISGVKFNYKL